MFHQIIFFRSRIARKKNQNVFGRQDFIPIFN